MPDIYYTIGPASLERSEDLFKAGANGVRLTFSFGTPEIQLERARTIAQVTQSVSVKPRIIAVLEGGGARIGEITTAAGRQSFSVKKDEVLELINESQIEISDVKQIPIPDTAIFESLAIGDRLIVGDGGVELVVNQVSSEGVFVKVEFSGELEARRGLFVQNQSFNPVCLTEKDLSDLDHISQHKEYDAIAVSFVNSAADIKQVKRVLKEAKSEQKVIAKIESVAGVKNIAEIVAVADEIMVARGDLALALPWQEMPAAVDTIVETCRESNTPFIMATQVAEGMLHGNSLTRAEMTDLWHWKQLGMRGVLLSRETAWGERPVETITRIRTLLEA